LKAELGEGVRHRTNRYLNNRLEQDHRGIKQRTRPMGGFKSVESARPFAASMTKCVTFSVTARGETRWYRSRNGGCSTRPHLYPIDYVSGGINENIK
jgi:transposase-like protein